MADTKLSVELTGDNTALMSSIDAAASKIATFAKDGAKDISGGLGELSTAFSALQGAIAGLAVVKFMKDSVAATVELGSEIRRLSSYFGLSAEHAGELAEALKRMGSSPEEFITMSSKLTKQIAGHEEAFKKYGIAIKDSNGEYRSQIDIMEDVGKKLNSIEGSTERNVAAQELLGKGGKEAARYMKMLAEESENSRKNLAAMGVSIDYEGLKASTKEYSKAMKDLNQDFNVMKIIVGQELMPSLKDGAEAMGSIIEPIAQGIAFAVKGVVTAFWTLNYVIQVVVAEVEDFGLKAMSAVTTLAQIIKAAATGHFSEIPEIYRKGNAELANIDKETKTILAQQDEEYGQHMLKIWGDGLQKKKQMSKDEESGGNDNRDDREKDQVIMDRMKARLEKLRVQKADELGIERDFYRLSAADTLEFWKGEVAHTEGSQKVLSQVNEQMRSARLAVRDEDDKQRNAKFAADLASLKGNYDAQIALAQTHLAEVRKTHVESDAEVQGAVKKVTELQNAKSEAIRKAEEERLTGERAHLKAVNELEIESLAISRDRHEISNEQYLRGVQRVNEAAYQEELKAARDKVALAGLDVAAKQKAMNELQALEDKHKSTVLKDNTALENELRKRNPWQSMAQAARTYVQQTKEIGTQAANALVSVMNSAQSSLSTAMQKMLTQGMSLRNGLRTIWQGISQAVLKSLTDMAAQFLVTSAVETFVHDKKVAQGTAEISLDQLKVASKQQSAAATVEAATTESTAETATVAPKTASAASGFFAAFASIPWVGLGLALAAIAAMMAIMKQLQGREHGGDVEAGQPYIVGEKRPELFVPRQSGTIIPNLAQAGANVYHMIHRSQIATVSGVSGAAKMQAAGASAGPVKPAVHFTVNSPIFASSLDGKRAIAQMVNDATAQLGRAQG